MSSQAATLGALEGVRPAHYLGVARIEDGDQAVFLSLETDGTGALYTSLRWIEICRWATDASRRFSFRTAETYGMVYAFSGTAAHDTMRGRLELLDGGGVRQRWALDVTFRPLDTEDRTARLLGVPGGVYSNVEYVQQAGDVAGVELFLGTVRGDVTMAVALAEGPTIGSIVLRLLAISGDTVRLGTGGSGGNAHDWTAVIAEREMELWFGDLRRGTAGVQMERLPRTHSLAEFYEEKAVATCPGQRGPDGGAGAKIDSPTNSPRVVDSAQVFDPDGYYVPEDSQQLDGYVLQHLQLHTLESYYDGHLHYDRPKVVPPMAYLTLIHAATHDVSRSRCAGPEISRDSLRVRCPATPIGDVAITGQFLDRRGRYWSILEYEVQPTVLVVARVTVTERGSVTYARDHRFVYTAGH